MTSSLFRLKLDWCKFIGTISANMFPFTVPHFDFTRYSCASRVGRKANHRTQNYGICHCNGRVAPFTDGEQLESYIEVIIALWNKTRPELIEGTWVWPEACQLDDEEVVNTAARDFCEGLLQGWQIARDDWETLMPEDSEDNALVGGVLLSLSMLYDPETSIATLAEQGIEGLEQFEEIFNAVPVMLCGLTQRGIALAEAQ